MPAASLLQERLLGPRRALLPQPVGAPVLE
jgi:hypothetical protein